MIQLSSKDYIRFWKKVRVKGKDECWEWMDIPNTNEYGLFRIGSKKYLAHVIAHFLQKGKCLKEVIMHTCDNKICCNPNHLVDATQRENVRDYETKRRDKHIGIKGQEHYKST